LFIPFSKLFDNNGDNTMSWGTFAYLCSILAVSRIIGSVYFSSIFIALNRTVPATHRATMNGLQTLGGSISKGLGPTFAGLLVAFSVSNGLWSPKVGGFVVWFVIGILGILNTLAVALCLREDPVDEDGHAMHADVEAEATGTKKV
jgi:MFS family permease